MNNDSFTFWWVGDSVRIAYSVSGKAYALAFPFCVILISKLQIHSYIPMF